MTLVPNARRLEGHLADALRDRPDGGVRVKPEVMILSRWVEETFTTMELLQGRPAPCVVDPYRLQDLWADALGTVHGLYARTERLLAAHQAREADRLIGQWWNDPRPPWLDEAYFSAIQRVHARLELMGLTTPERLIFKLTTRLQSSDKLSTRLSRKIILDGFHEITAAEADLFEALRAAGVEVIDQQTNSGVATGCSLISFPTLDQELSAAAEWAHDVLDQGAGGLPWS
ncbi:hypothetical protein [Candidatus Leptofilum sp.]|uniref:hypothetical protein n=1 Tax=Candidatus Leptofilum sp. TaxID=3241576 RepID=UPI003B5A63CB